jgi:glycosyltransferase involved in cell wall biosynthesis
VRPDRILQSQNAVDEERFLAAVRPAWDLPQKPVVLHVGQLIERKGVGLLLDAAATLQREGCRFSLLLVGNGRYKQELERRAQALDLKNVYFKPAQAPEQMPAVYRSGDLLVFPTLEDVWGLVANEAILSGLPVLCSKYAGCASELFPPENIFSPDDPAELVEKLRIGLAGQLRTVDRARLRPMPALGEQLVLELNAVLA